MPLFGAKTGFLGENSIYTIYNYAFRAEKGLKA
jgi:hypothetical protein